MKLNKKILWIIPLLLLISIIIGIIVIRNMPEKKFYLEDKYYGGSDFIEIKTSDLEKLIDDKESFALFVYQPACVTSANFEQILKDFSNSDLVYTADKLIEAGYLDCIKSRSMDEECPTIIAKSITYAGHQFLDNIRDDKVFAKTKSVLSGLNSVSVEIISETASKVITNMINQQLGL